MHVCMCTFVCLCAFEKDGMNLYNYPLDNEDSIITNLFMNTAISNNRNTYYPLDI